MTFLELDVPQRLPSRNAAAALHQHIIEQITQRRPAVGETLLPADELAERFGVSLSTMNRVLEGLQREGWIERRAGRGTFIGLRAGAVTESVSAPSTSPDHRRLRLAVTVCPWETEHRGWLEQGLLEGLDQAVQDENISIELIGRGDDNYDRFARRMAQSHPNLLIMLKPPLISAPMIREAERLGIPVIVTGTRLRDLGRVTVQEDGRQGVADAVRYLADHGHQHIGLLIPDEPAPLYYDRRNGYEQGLAEAGLPLDQNLTLWLKSYDYTAALADYLDRMRPSAVILASGAYLRSFRPLVESGRLSIPRDLSLIAFDQFMRQATDATGGPVPTTIELPMAAMTREVIRLARQMLMGQEVPKITSIACRIIEGETVLRIGGS